MDDPPPGAPPDPTAPPAAPVDVAAATAVVDRSAAERRRAWPQRRTLADESGTDLIAALEHARGRIRSNDADPAWTDALDRLVRERRAVDDHDERVRAAVRDGIREAMGALDDAPSSWDVVDRAPVAVCGACGFTRSLVSAVRGSRWVPLVVHTREDLDPRADTFRAFVSEHLEIPLANMLGETEIVRRREAMRFNDPANDRRTFKPIIEAAGSPGYAAAPIVVGTRTLGFLHVDRVGQDAPISEDDRLALGAFAVDLGWVFDRASTEEVLRRRAEEVEDAIARTRSTLGRIAAAPEDGTIGETLPGASAPRSDPPARRDALLTDREREILELVGDGATNWAVAQRLTLSEETVKTHLRTIRRKLHVRSRGAAVARYRRLRDDADG